MVDDRRARDARRNAARRALAALRPRVPTTIRTSTWRRLNAGLMVKHISLFGPLPAAPSEHIRPDLTEWAGTTLIQSDERSYA